MQLHRAERKRAKIKMALQGPSGSGKTMSALILAFGLCGDWSKIAVIDTENNSSELYSHLGSYNALQLTSPFTPEKYIEAVEVCEESKMEVIIIDSATHEWEHLIEFHSSMQGNSFTNWGKITPRHNLFIQKILQSTAHIICTTRTKQEYVLSEKQGKIIPEKVGLKSIQRDGLDYEFTLVFHLDMKNYASVNKDRTGLFYGHPDHKLSIETGRKINDWCNNGDEVNLSDVSIRINKCKSLQELLALYQLYPQFNQALKPEFENRKRELIINPETSKLISTQKTSNNGTNHK